MLLKEYCKNRLITLGLKTQLLAERIKMRRLSRQIRRLKARGETLPPVPPEDARDVVLVQTAPDTALDEKHAFEIISTARRMYNMYATPKELTKVPHELPYHMFRGMSKHTAERLQGRLANHKFYVEIREIPPNHKD
jgi:hypothetical protein